MIGYRLSETHESGVIGEQGTVGGRWREALSVRTDASPR